MKYELAIVPPGGGECDHTIEVQSERIPGVGEYITIMSEDGRLEAYRVLYVVNGMKFTGQGKVASDIISVQAEYVSHPYQSDEHKRSIEMYANRGKKASTFPESGY